MNGEVVNPWAAAAAASLGTGGVMGLVLKFLVTSWVKAEEEFKERTRDELEALRKANIALELRLEGMKLIDQRLTAVDDRVKIDHNRLSRVEDVAEKVRWIVESERRMGPDERRRGINEDEG